MFYNKIILCLCMFRAHVLIIRRSKLHYTASGIITPIGGRLRRPPTGVTIHGAYIVSFSVYYYYYYYYYHHHHLLCAGYLYLYS